MTIPRNRKLCKLIPKVIENNSQYGQQAYPNPKARYDFKYGFHQLDFQRSAVFGVWLPSMKWFSFS